MLEYLNRNKNCLLVTRVVSFQTCLRHPECESARKNRHGLFVQMHQALDLIHSIVTDTSYQTNGHGDVSPMMLNGDSGIALGGPQPRAHRALREFDVSVNKPVIPKLCWIARNMDKILQVSHIQTVQSKTHVTVNLLITT